MRVNAGKLSPSADQSVGRMTVQHAQLATVTSPSSDQCCGQTAMRDLYAKCANARRHCCGQA